MPLIDLSRNESPYPLDKRLQKALSQVVSSLHRYPIGREEATIEAIARLWSVPSGRIMLTRGVDEATDRLIEHFPDRLFLVVVPGFDGFTRRLAVMRQPHAPIHLDVTFGIADDSLGAVSGETFVLLANPNNPTGVSIAQRSLRMIVERGAGLLVDETYFEFQGEPSQLAATAHRTFVFRSLSKCFALAGLRLGALVGPETAIAAMRSRQWFCNLDTFALRAIELLLHSSVPAVLAKCIVEEREQLAGNLAANGFNVKKTVTNFVLIEHPTSDRLADFLLDAGIVVRRTESMGLPNHIRISVGSAQENRRVVNCLKEFVRQSGGTHG